MERHAGIGGHRIVIRNRWSFDPSMEISEARVARYRRDHERAFRNRSDAEGCRVRVQLGWAACLSRNSVPALASLSLAFSAYCQNGLGTAKGTLAGIGAVEQRRVRLTHCSGSSFL